MICIFLILFCTWTKEINISEGFFLIDQYTDQYYVYIDQYYVYFFIF